ncbi:MAG: PepSY-associated TM helix domain-containing protein [Bacteroidetes bacterium]|nr:PepSY-associated TM helix domain-containing protein [Bacteroidota bacterium]MCK4287769.1 PepSY-associated TM helix domain-containing protein [Bacteroidales bacterium]
MKFKWRKWNRIIHRDFGYFFFGMTIIYALSGIAINHIRDWNPNYVIKTQNISVNVPDEINKSEVLNILKILDEEKNYKKHYFPKEDQLKVFLKNGTLTLNLNSGNGIIEKVKVRPIFKPVNYLHYNPIKWWTWFSDIFAGALILIAISGLFILKGKKGITKRGAWLTILGILIPVIYLLIFYY